MIMGEVTDARLIKAGETLDNLMCTDIASRGIVNHLYKAARSLSEQPLSYRFAQELKNRLQPMDKVFIVTGWIDQPLVSPDHGESDGPAGAVAIARALSVACSACPIIIVDECLVKGMQEVAKAAGFECVPVENLEYAVRFSRLRTVAVLGFPRGVETGKFYGRKLIEEYKPAACISIERGGVNKAGIIHNMLGMDTGINQTFMDDMFNYATEKSIFTAAIGDGGNEIGMGNILETVKKMVPYGNFCKCGCNKGIGAAIQVDFLLTAAISNWGAYAVAAMLALLSQNMTALQDATEERYILESSGRAGFHDAMFGCLGSSVDGCPADSHVALVTLMRQVVNSLLK